MPVTHQVALKQVTCSRGSSVAIQAVVRREAVLVAQISEMVISLVSCLPFSSPRLFEDYLKVCLLNCPAPVLDPSTIPCLAPEAALLRSAEFPEVAQIQADPLRLLLRYLR